MTVCIYTCTYVCMCISISIYRYVIVKYLYAGYPLNSNSIFPISQKWSDPLKHIKTFLEHKDYAEREDF